MRVSQSEKRAAEKRGGSAEKSWGFAAIAVGIILAIWGSNQNDEAFGLIGGTMIGLGFVFFIIGRFQD